MPQAPIPVEFVSALEDALAMILAPCYAFVTLLPNSSCTAHKPQIHPSPNRFLSRTCRAVRWGILNGLTGTDTAGVGPGEPVRSVRSQQNRLLTYRPACWSAKTRKPPERASCGNDTERSRMGGKTPPSRASLTECQATLSVYVLVCFVFFAQ